jgi:hypothetical protein
MARSDKGSTGRGLSIPAPLAPGCADVSLTGHAEYETGADLAHVERAGVTAEADDRSDEPLHDLLGRPAAPRLGTTVSG